VAALVGAAGLSLVAAGHSPEASDPWATPAVYEFEVRVELPAASHEGRSIALWVPYPAEGPAQRLRSTSVSSPWPWRLGRDPKYGNRMIYTAGEARPESAEFVLRLEVERLPYRGVPVDGRPLEGGWNPGLFRGPDRLVPLEGLIRQVAEQESRGLEAEAAKARAFYRYVLRSMRYDKSGEGWGRGDAVWACTNRRGNCTDFHSLFIGLLRSEGIPARFVIGFPIPEEPQGEVPGYHCWAEFFDPSRGWIPVDATEAKRKGLEEAYFGALPNDRIEIAVGRDLVLDPPQKGEPLNYFVYPYAELDGRPWSGPKATYRFWRQRADVAAGG
jgi:transglutaminase-like putative cysteine protease